ncbi:tape measure protein [uncultured Alistipes sp.]|uniref:tape measure protein n=1 Tax=uncultured Alistipes sp. TaxID=538949 RepID=UPI0032080494
MQTDNGRLNFSAGIDTSQLRRDASESRSILHSIGQSAKQEGEEIDRAFKNIGKTIAGAFAVQQLMSFASSVVKVRGEIQALEVSFATLLGSEEKATRLFREIREFEVKTPMTLEPLAKGAQTLLGFGVAAEKVMPVLRQIGDISMGNAERFQSLILAFAQVSANGRLMGQDLLQMVNAGFNPLSIISERTGKSIAVLSDEMSKGEISAQMIEEAFAAAAAEGGKFYGMLEAQSQTINGALSNLEGAWNSMLNEMGEQTEGVFADAVSLATYCIEHYETFLNILLSIASAYGTYKAALIGVWVIEQARNLATNIQLVMMFRKELGLLTAAQQAFNITTLKNPYILLAAAIVGAVTALVAFTKQTDKTQERIDAANEKLEQQAQEFEKLKEKKDAATEAERSAAQSVSDEINRIEILNNTIHDNTASLDDRRRAITQMQGLVPEYHATLDDEGRLHRDNTTAIDEHIKALNRLAMARALQDKRQEYSAQKLNAEIDRRTAKRDEATAQQNLNAANQRVTSEQAAYNSRMQEWDAATTESDNFFVRAAFASREGQMSRQGTAQMERAALEAAERNREAAEAELAVAQGQVALADERIRQADEQIGMLDDMLKDYQDVDLSSTTPTTTTTTTGGGKKKDPRDSTLSSQEYDASVKMQVRQAELDQWQERINGYEEGMQKYTEQVELNYEKMKLANEQREADMVDALREQMQTEWENANPNATDQERDAHRLELQTSVTKADLSQGQLDVLKEYTRLAEEYRETENRKTLDKMLADVMTYEQQRAQIEEEYARRRADMYVGGKVENGLREGVTQGNVDELNLQEQNALTAIDEQFAQREAEYEAWCDWIATLSLEKLQEVLEQAEKELADLEKSGTGDSQQIAVARAKVANAKSKVDEQAAKQNQSPDKRSIEEWNDLRESLEDCVDAFEEVGDAVGGVAGDIISTAGSIATSTLSMINGIVQLVNMSATGMQGTATAAATAIATVEKASVILAVISAAMQIAMQIINLFNNDDKKQEEIEALQERIDQLQWELDNADAVRLQQNSFNAMEKLREVTSQVRMEFYKLRLEVGDSWGAFSTIFKSLSSDEAMLTKASNELAKAYGNIAYTADKALGGADYDSAKDQLKNIAEQQLLIQEQINAEQSKKDTDQGKIDEWEQKIQELGEQAVTIINEMVEDIIGGSAADIADELGSAFIEAFQNGEDAAEAWGEKVNEIVADIMKRMLVKQLEERIGGIFDKYKEKWFKDGEFHGLDAVINSMGGFAADLNAVSDKFAVIWDNLPDSVKNMFTTTADAREASEQGIASASQESVDELNGRATAIQSHTYSINENTKLLVANSSAILECVIGIEQNTQRIADRMDVVEISVRDIRNDLADITIKGVKIN